MTRIIILFLLISKTTFGQIDSTKAQVPDVTFFKGSGGLMLGGHFIGKTINGEIGYIKSNVTKVKDYRADIRDSVSKSAFYLTQPYSAITVGSEFFLKGDNTFGVGPKIGFEYSFFLIFHARMNLVYYTDFGSLKDFRVSPTVGLSLGFMNVMYNLNLPVLKTHYDNIATNRVSVIFFIAKRQ